MRGELHRPGSKGREEYGDGHDAVPLERGRGIEIRSKAIAGAELSILSWEISPQTDANFHNACNKEENQ